MTCAHVSQIVALMWQKLSDHEKNEYKKKAGEGLYNMSCSERHIIVHVEGSYNMSCSERHNIVHVPTNVFTVIQVTAMRTERRRAATSPTRRAARPPRMEAAATRTWETTTVPSSVNIMSLEIASSVMQG